MEQTGMENERQSSLLLQKIKTERIEDTIAKRALAYIPADYSINTKCNIYLFLPWEMGDVLSVYPPAKRTVYNFRRRGPSIVINLSFISKLYGETVEEQSKVLDGILSQEIFTLFVNTRSTPGV